jgi:hypothetical protein
MNGMLAELAQKGAQMNVMTTRKIKKWLRKTDKITI